MSRGRGGTRRILAAALLGLWAAPGKTAWAEAAGPDSVEACQRLRFADIGWSDVAATTALTAALLRRAGYAPHIEILSLPVTLMGLKTGDVDVFLGNWMPAQRDAVA